MSEAPPPGPEIPVTPTLPPPEATLAPGEGGDPAVAPPGVDGAAATPAGPAPWVAERSAEVAVRRSEVSATEALVNQVKFMFGGERSAAPSRVAQMRERVQAVAEQSPLFGEVGGRYQRVREASERMMGEISPENRQELVQIAEAILRTGGDVTKMTLETRKALRRPEVGARLAAVLARVDVATEAENQINAELGAVPDRPITYEQRAMIDALSHRADFMALGSEIAEDMGRRFGGAGRIDYGHNLRMVLEDQKSRVVAMGKSQRGELGALHRAKASLLQRFPDQADRINEAYAQHIAQATESRAVRETPPPAVVAGPEAYDRLNAQIDKFVWTRPEHRTRLMQELGAVQVRNEETGETTWTLRRGSLGEQMVQQMENARSAQQKFEATLETSRNNPMVGDLLVYRGHEAFQQTQLSRNLESQVMQRVEAFRAAQLKQAKLELNRTLARFSDTGFRERWFKTFGESPLLSGRQANLDERNALQQRRVELYEEINRLIPKKPQAAARRPTRPTTPATPAEARPAAPTAAVGSATTAERSRVETVEEFEGEGPAEVTAEVVAPITPGERPTSSEPVEEFGGEGRAGEEAEVEAAADEVTAAAAPEAAPGTPVTETVAGVNAGDAEEDEDEDEEAHVGESDSAAEAPDDSELSREEGESDVPAEAVATTSPGERPVSSEPVEEFGGEGRAGEEAEVEAAAPEVENLPPPTVEEFGGEGPVAATAPVAGEAEVVENEAIGNDAEEEPEAADLSAGVQTFAAAAPVTSAADLLEEVEDEETRRERWEREAAEAAYQAQQDELKRRRQGRGGGNRRRYEPDYEEF